MDSKLQSGVETDEETMSKSPVGILDSKSSGKECEGTLEPVGKKRNEETIISDSKSADQDSSSKSSGKECEETLKPVGKKRNVDESSKSTLDGKETMDSCSKSSGKECEETLKPVAKKRYKDEVSSESVLVGKETVDSCGGKEGLCSNSSEGGGKTQLDNDDDDEEIQLMKIILEYTNTTMRDPNHGTTCMNHFYKKWIKRYDYSQASGTQINLSAQIAYMFSRYENELINFPEAEVSVEDEYRFWRDDPIGLKKFRLAHEIWKHTRGIDGPCNRHCSEDSPDHDEYEEFVNLASLLF